MQLVANHPGLSPFESAYCGFENFRPWRVSEARFDSDSLSWVRSSLGGLPARFRKRIEETAIGRLQSGGMFAAGSMIRDVRETLSGRAINLAQSEDDIRSLAKLRARECRGLWDYAACERLARRTGVALPDVKKTGVKGALMRLWDESWWRRAIRTSIAREVERHAITLGFVHRRAGKYSSDEAVKRRGEQKKRNRAMLESVLAVNEIGQEYTLEALAELSVSNPKIRRGELMMRIAGFESIAKASGHVGEFYTLTCPSKYHARISVSCTENPKYQGLHPREGQRYLSKTWSRIRAQLAKHGIRLYGFRVAEPQHDGTPHWHMLVFMAGYHVAKVREVMRAQCLKMDGAEPGAAEHRFTAVAIDWSRGSAAGYIAKYIAKNIDGYGLDADIDGGPIDDGARRVDAWASTWGIRQFQQLGGAPVTVWRELRKIEEAGGLIGEAALAADKADWAKYTELQGGVMAKRAEMPIQLLRVWSGVMGRYGDEIGNIIKGLECAGESVITHVHNWVLRFSEGLKGFALPRSSVNNCNSEGVRKRGFYDDGVTNVRESRGELRKNWVGRGDDHGGRSETCGKGGGGGGFREPAGAYC